MPRSVPTTSWSRNRFLVWITDIHGSILTDINSNPVLGITETNPLNTSWT